MTRNGTAIFKVTDTEQNASFVNGNTVKITKLDAMLKHNSKRNENERNKVIHERRIQNNKRRKWREYTIDSFTFIGVRVAVMSCCMLTMIVGMMHPVISIPVSVYCVCTACIRFGVWYGCKH